MPPADAPMPTIVTLAAVSVSSVMAEPRLNGTSRLPRFFTCELERLCSGKCDAHPAFAAHLRLAEEAYLCHRQLERVLETVERYLVRIAFDQQRRGRGRSALHDVRHRQAEDRTRVERELRKILTD